MNLRTLLKKLTPAICAFVAVVSTPAFVQAQSPEVDAGKKLFEENCTSCHAFEKKVTGPALGGVTSKRQEDWLQKWIKNAPKMLSDKDPIATTLLNEYNGVMMSSFEFMTDEQVKNIIAYLKTNPKDIPAGGAEAASTPTTLTTGNVETAEAESNIKGIINTLIIVIILTIIIIIGWMFDLLGLFSRYTGIKFSDPDKGNARMMIFFFVVGMAAVIWEFAVHGKYVIIGDSASEHGVAVDSMLMTTLWITGAVFIITQAALFIFGFLYRRKPGRKALYYPHNNMLEYVWTIIPAIALTVLVINGFKKWSHITKKAPDNAETVEVYAFQFGWSARYAGHDGKLGQASFNLISGSNPLGLAVEDQYGKVVAEVDTALAKNMDLYKRMQKIKDPTHEEKEEMAALMHSIKLQKAHRSRLEGMKGNKTIFDNTATDDIVLKEIVLQKNKPVNFAFRARDVIHSAYSPHFRMQMNCVPGLPTYFWFTPTKTTDEMRGILDDPKFDYYVFCAKICGSSHYNMKIKVRVLEEAEFKKWQAEQKPAFGPAPVAIPASDKTVAPSDSVKTDSGKEMTMLLEPTHN